MAWYYFKTALRNLWNNKKFSVINITGFAFGITVCLAITLYLIKEYSYDRYHANTAQISRLINTEFNSSSIDYRVKDIVADKFPEVENACLVQQISMPMEVKVGDQGQYLGGVLSVDNDFFNVFTVPFKAGNPEKPFTNIHSAVITESAANQLFGDENPLGKEILFQNDHFLTVNGVIEDFPDNSSIGAPILVNAENNAFKFSFSCEDSRDVSTHRWPFRIYLQLNKEVNSNEFVAKLNLNNELMHPYVSEMGLLPLKDIYLSDPTYGSQTKRGNPGLLSLLGIIAAIILALAIINYINLTVAQQNKRNKDTGVKKTIGANRSNILFHFIFESVIVSVAAFTLAVMLLGLLLPFFNSVLNSNLDLNLLFEFPYIIVVLLVALFIGILSGCGPAIALSGINPVKVISGNILSEKKNYLQNSLTIFQFMVSIILIFCVMVVQRQIQFVKHKNLGFSDEQLLRVDMPNLQEKDSAEYKLLVDELIKSPFIKSISAATGVPGSIPMNMGSNVENNENNISIPCLLVDTAFIRTFGLTITHGRGLMPGDFEKVCMINESAFKHFEFDNLENKRINNGRAGGFEIIGVVNDFHYGSMHEKIGPVCIMFASMGRRSTVNILFNPNSAVAGLNYFKQVWQNIFPGYPITYQFYDDWFDSMYQAEERFARTISMFALLAIAISCIGILGLSVFISERRIKEIGIRKVNGAKISEVLTMLNKDFVKWVAVAFIVACPVAWFAMNKWLENFAYKTTLSWWIFALAGLLALGIALLTVSFQSWRAATRNPVEALRYE